MAESDVKLLETRTVASAQNELGRLGGMGVWLPELRRLSVGTAGPIAVAGTHFLASLLLWGHVSAEGFGQFAFLIILVQFSQGLSNALVCTPIAVAPHDAEREAYRGACLAAHGLLLVGVAAAIAAIFVFAGAGDSVPAYVALVVTANLRWAARSYAIADEKVVNSTLSDGAYATVVALLLTLLVLIDRVGPGSVALVLTCAHIAALAALSRPFLARQLAALNRSALRYYRQRIWPMQAGWALVGVTSTEASSNAHAYIVTWLFGAALYAPLAFGALFCRPITIFLTALMQIDRPVLARLLSQAGADRIRGRLRMSFAAVGAIWLGNLLAALGALWLFEPQIAARDYDAGQMRTILAIWFAVVALRAARNPLSTFVQASHAFRPLAFASLASAGASILAVSAFTYFGPTYSLLGILCGEMLLLGLVASLTRKYLA